MRKTCLPFLLKTFYVSNKKEFIYKSFKRFVKKTQKFYYVRKKALHFYESLRSYKANKPFKTLLIQQF